MAPSSFSLRDLLSDQSPSQPSSLSSNVSPSNGFQGQDANDVDSPGTAKRRRMTTSDFTRRKRTAVACQFCRVRKTKCDNVRPQCGYCVRQKAKCVYGDMDAEEAEPEPSRPSVSNEQLMGRLDEIQEMLRRSTLSTDPFSSPSTTAASMGPGSVHAATSPQTRSTAPIHGNQRAPLPGLRCESILNWPCFAGVIPAREAGIDSFPLSANYEEARGIQSDSSQGGRGIREDAFVPL
jgi:Zn(2)-Cys(6) binuclear cluster domain-containing protein